ncbi:hypothetical protein CNE_BB1p01810 (plasmid) [Cupriavidus necator N-1]|uniref:Molybdopterin oxidoreductase domain-containing protein n=1 Tax=Cupriavidus necator (strain ATCC 43291 / DSM 13513 / CCUG 52238 / LMG 8453 / N-1) TaxID=1042878 RepID=F8GVW6_CUPNN|nr:hypothetical protein CNE_BB1p01810 [Cupriavidus necator N-1]
MWRCVARNRREAWARPQTVIVQDICWTATARHADIVLPVTTALERNDIGGSSRNRHVLAMHQAIAPLHRAPAATSLRRVRRRGRITADEGGLFIPATRAGDLVHEGASIGDTLKLDASLTAVKPFTHDGIPIGLRSDPVVHTGERLAFVETQLVKHFIQKR